MPTTILSLSFSECAFKSKPIGIMIMPEIEITMIILSKCTCKLISQSQSKFDNFS